MDSPVQGAPVLEILAAAVRSCTWCRLHTTRTVAVPGEGPATAAVLLIGEAPGKDEDLSGRPFVGRAGRILERALEAAGLPRGSVFITNVVKCRPPGNRKPRSNEVETCRPYLLAEIREVQPQIIVTLGSTALRGLMGPGLDLKEARHQSLHLGTLPVRATYHPAAVLYNRALEKALRRDLRKVARAIEPHRVTSRRRWRLRTTRQARSGGGPSGRRPSRDRAARR